MKFSLIGKRNFFVFILLLFLAISFILLFFVKGDIKTVNYVFLLLVIPSYFLMFLANAKIHLKTNIYTIILALSFFFFYGHYLLVAFGFGDRLQKEYISILSDTISVENVYKGEIIFLQALIILVIFSCFSKNKTSDINNKVIIIPSYFNTIAKTIFLFSAVFTIITFSYEIGFGTYIEKRDFEREFYTFSSGNILFFIKYFSKWFVPSCYMLLIANSKNGKKAFFKYSFPIVVYSILYVLTGQRYELIQIFTALIIIYFIFFDKLKKRTIVFLVPFVVVGIILMTAVSYIRFDSVNRNIFTYFEMIRGNLISEAVYSVFSESGTTACSLINTIEHCPNDIPYGGADFFIRLFFIAFPSVLNPFSELTTTTISSMFSPFMYGTVKSGYGSSFVTEAYYYWGNGMYFYFVALGLLMMFLLKKLNKQNCNALEVFVSVYVFSELSFCVRSDVTLIFREILYYCLVPSVFIYLLSKKNKKYLICSNKNINHFTNVKQ